jgi:hypothetical protein
MIGKIIKNVLLICVLIAALIIMSACSKKEEAPDILPGDILNKVLSELESKPAGTLLTSENKSETAEIASIMLGDAVINSELIQSYAIYPAIMNITAYEIGILKVPYTPHVTDAEAFANQRIQHYKDSFETYLADQYEIAKKGEVRSMGDYVYYAVTKDSNDKVFEIIEGILKDPASFVPAETVTNPPLDTADPTEETVEDTTEGDGGFAGLIPG